MTELCRPFGPARAGIGLLTPRWTLTDRVSGLLDSRRVAMTRMSIRGRLAVAAALATGGVAGAGIRFDGTTRADEPHRAIQSAVVAERNQPPARAEQKAKAPAERVASVSASPSGQEIEELVRAIGRDPATPELLDRIALWFRPQVIWAHDFERTRTVVADPEFVRRVDAVAKGALGRPLNTFELIRAAAYHAGYDNAMLAHFFRSMERDAKVQPTEVKGVVRDGMSGRPVAGARVYSDDAITRTDDQGRFVLRSRPRTVERYGPMVSYWVEADGYALRESVAQLFLGQGREWTVHLRGEVRFEGRVVDDQERPVPRAIVSAAVRRSAVARDTNVKKLEGGNVVMLAVRTGEDGRFSVPGVPVSEEQVLVTVSHPAYQDFHVNPVAPTMPDEPLIVRLRPGCVVSGVVRDGDGHPVAGASVEVRLDPRRQLRARPAQPDLRRPPNPGAEHRTVSDAQGRFQFHNIKLGPGCLLVQSERFAAAFVPIHAEVAQPVEIPVVLSRGGYIAGKVVGEDGGPVADAAVGWANSSGGEMQDLSTMTCTADDGTFRLGPLPQGEFQITALAEPPRRLGKASGKVDDVVIIELKPDPIPPRR